MNGALQVLRLELGADHRAFVERVEELEGLALATDTADPNLLARAAVALHHAYGTMSRNCSPDNFT